MSPRLQKRYRDEAVPALRRSFGYENPMQVPRLVKVVVNMGVKTSMDRDALTVLSEDLAKVTGQRPLITKARKSIANFRLREGMSVGLKVTLRGVRMYEFLDRLFNVALPRMRDFRGLSPKAFDGRGNYSMGLGEQTFFPEIDPDRIKVLHGMDITMTTDAATDDEARQLLKLLGLPFAEQ